MERAFCDYPSTSKKQESHPLPPRLARGFSLSSAYQKATTKNVVASILPLILHAIAVYSLVISEGKGVFSVSLGIWGVK